MPSHRIERVSEAIREVVSSAILFETADPRITGVTVLRAEVAGDMRHATVYVSIMGSEAQQKQVLTALKHATGFIQGKVADRLQTRFTPVLTFKSDDSVKKSVAMSHLFDELAAARGEARTGEAVAPEAANEAGELTEREGDE